MALVEIQTSEPVFVDAIQLDDGQLYVAGHTETDRPNATSTFANGKRSLSGDDCLSDYELRLTPTNEHAGLEIARRQCPVPFREGR